MNYSLFLRGINVGGIKMPMPALKQQLERLGLKRVKTYIQTGNVTFVSESTVEKLTPQIEDNLKETFSFSTKVILIKQVALKQIVAEYPFTPRADFHDYVIFCRDNLARDSLLKSTYQPALGELIAGGLNVVYWQVAKGLTLKTAFAKNQTKVAIKDKLTTRNLNTLKKMIG